MDKRFFEDTIVTDSATAILGNFSAMEQEYQIAFQPGWFQPLFLVLDPRPQEALHADAFLPVLQVEALVREFFTPHGVELVCYVKDHTLSVILNTPQPLPDCRGLCRSFLSLCSRRFPWYCGPNTITVGLGNPTQDSRQLPLAIQSAKFAGWMRFGLGKGRIIPYPDSYGGYVKKEDFLPEENRRTLQRSVELMDFPLCRQTILESLEATKNSGEFISVALTLGDVLVEALNHYGKETVVHSSKYLQLAENMPPMVESMDSTTRMQDAILSWAEHGIAQLQGMEAQGEDGSILRAKQYIALNYQNPLRLDDVAQHVGLSAPYFSIKFRKCTGSTFVEYLTGLRMERAKELLLSTNRKVLDIATAVGFQDARHFSRIFKKYMGVLPTEFRRKH
jgi:AraC-like DNA-binding protein